MTVDLKQRTDKYRLAAEKYGWGECSYLVRPSHTWRAWMSERDALLWLLKPLLTLRLFAGSEGRHPEAAKISLSLVVNDRNAGCQLYHVTAEYSSLEALMLGSLGSVSSRNVFHCNLAYCDVGDALPLPNSGWEGSRVPYSEEAMGSAG